MSFKVKRGLKSNLSILKTGELGYCTDTNELFIGSPSGNTKIYPNNLMPSLDHFGDVDTSNNRPIIGDQLIYKDGNWQPGVPVIDTKDTTNIYIVELDRWEIKQGIPSKPYTDDDFIMADKNVIGFNNAIQYAYENGYSEVIIPKGEYAICYPRIIKITQSNLTINFNFATLKVIFDSDRRSPFDTSTTKQPYEFGGICIAISRAFNVHVKNANLIGCKVDRSFIAANEKSNEWSYGIQITEGSSYCKVSHCKIRSYMGDGISYNSTSFREYAEFALNLTSGLLDENTGQPVVSPIGVTSGYIPIEGSYNAFSVEGFGYTRITAILGKEIGIFFYKADNTFIGALPNRKIYTHITVPKGATKFKMVFYRDTNVSKGMAITLKWGLTPHHNVVEFNEVFDGHRGGMTGGGSYNMIQYNVIRDIGTGLLDGDPIFPDPTRYGINQEDSYGDNCVIKNNIIYNTNHGILLGCYSVLVENNHIYNCSGTGINLYTLNQANIRKNLIYNCISTVGVMSAEFQNAHVNITGNTFVGGGANYSGNGYDIYVRWNSFIDPKGNIFAPDVYNVVFSDNIVKYYYNTATNPNHTINRIERCTFESYIPNKQMGLAAYEIVDCNFKNIKLNLTNRITTKKEKIVFNNCSFNKGSIESYIYNPKARRIEIRNSKLVDTVYSVGNINTMNEIQEIGIYNSEIYSNTLTHIMADEFNMPFGTYGILEIDNCKIAISNSNFSNLIKHINNAQSLKSNLIIKNNTIKYTGNGILSVPYYNLNAQQVRRLIISNNKLSNINLSIPEPSVTLNYNPLTHAIDNPIRGEFEVSDIVYNAMPTSGSNVGWICLSSGVACANVWTANKDTLLHERIHSGGYVYENQNAGITMGTEPIFPTTIGSTVEDKIGILNWEASKNYSIGDIILPTTPNGWSYKCTKAGTSETIEPTWPKNYSHTVNDNTVTWTATQVVIWKNIGPKVQFKSFDFIS